MAPAGCIAPPPGLEDLMPAKVALPVPELRPTKVSLAASLDFGAGQQLWQGLAEQVPPSMGDWTAAVVEASPHLSPEGLRRAVAIVDRAIKNTQQAKALDMLIGGVYCGVPALELRQAARMREQVGQQQQQLLMELRRLRLDYGARAVEPAPMPEPQPEPAMQRPMKAAAPAMGPAPGQAAKAPCGRPAAAATVGQQEWQLQQQKAAANKQVQTLSSSLQLLSREDPRCLFIVRRINKLGFKATRSLKRHFSAYGPVVRVLVAHSTVRQQGAVDSHARRRPSSLGFVQMSSPCGAAKVIDLGPEHIIDGAPIRVQKFERQQMNLVREAEQEEDEEPPTNCAWHRLVSSCSDASTATSYSHSALTVASRPRRFGEEEADWEASSDTQ